MRFIELYRSIMQGVWNIGFVENTLDEVIDGKSLKINWLKHDCKDRWFADPFILDVTDDKIYVLVEEYYYPHKRGRLAMLTVDRASNTLLKVDTILELDSHLSFPAIIRRDGKILVYPENFKGGGLKLYELDLEKPQVFLCGPACRMEHGLGRLRLHPDGCRRPADGSEVRQGEGIPFLRKHRQKRRRLVRTQGKAISPRPGMQRGIRPRHFLPANRKIPGRSRVQGIVEKDLPSPDDEGRFPYIQHV